MKEELDRGLKVLDEIQDVEWRGEQRGIGGKDRSGLDGIAQDSKGSVWNYFNFKIQINIGAIINKISPLL